MKGSMLLRAVVLTGVVGLLLGVMGAANALRDSDDRVNGLGASGGADRGEPIVVRRRRVDLRQLVDPGWKGRRGNDAPG